MRIEFMQLALEEAKKAPNEIPIGAVIVKDNKIIAKTHNLKEFNNNPTHHAEILAISEASKKLNRWRLEDCEIYATLEPCPMCATAILFARFRAVYFGAYDNLYGAFGSKLNMSKVLNTKINIKGGILEAECEGLLKDFFTMKRL